MAVAQADQTRMDEQIVDDADLEAALEAREAAKEKAGFANKTYREAKTQAEAALEGQELADGDVIRVGRFRVEKKAVAGRSVAFDTSPSSRLTIRADKE